MRGKSLSEILSLFQVVSKLWKVLFRYEKVKEIPDGIRILIGVILLGGLVAWIVLTVYYDPRFIVIPVLLMIGGVR